MEFQFIPSIPIHLMDLFCGQTNRTLKDYIVVDGVVVKVASSCLITT